MTYYSNKEWWDTRYKIRRPIALEPKEYEPGSESLCAVRLDKGPLVGKVKSDYSDFKVIFQSESVSPVAIPFYILDESADEISIIFKTGEPILVSSDSLYYLYYGAKSETRLSDATDILDPESLDLEDEGQNVEEEERTRWTFQKPSVLWSYNQANKSGSRALFEFTGHKVDLYFTVGPSYGMFEYQINELPKVQVDSYSGSEAVSKLVSIDVGKVQVNKVRITVLGQRNPASTSDLVKLNKAVYHQILMGLSEPEEFYSGVGKSYTVGS